MAFVRTRRDERCDYIPPRQARYSDRRRRFSFEGTSKFFRVVEVLAFDKLVSLETTALLGQSSLTQKENCGS